MNERTNEKAVRTNNKQEAGVLSQSTNATSEADDKDEKASDDEQKSGIEWNLTQLSKVLEHVLLSPSPQSNGKHHTTQQLIT